MAYAKREKLPNTQRDKGNFNKPLHLWGGFLLERKEKELAKVIPLLALS